jgi:hypothetical protein
MTARRESIQSVKEEENHSEENQAREAPQAGGEQKQQGRKEASTKNSLLDPEAEFRNRLKARHGDLVDAAAVAHCVLRDLRWDFKQLESFLDFEAKQTTDPQRLRNPPGHYRRVVQEFRQACTSRRDYSSKQEQLMLEARLKGEQPRDAKPRPPCPLSRCDGTGEYWNEQGFVEACDCEHGQKLSPKVIEVFRQLNAIRRPKLEFNRES